LQKLTGNHEAGVGKAVAFLTVVLLLAITALALTVSNREAPSIKLQREIRGIGVSTPVELTVRDSHYRIKSVVVEVHQGDRTFQIPVESSAWAIRTPEWWKVWSRRVESSATFKASVGRKEIPDLKEGSATLIVTATNDSWGRFFRGGQSQLIENLTVRFAPPRAEVLTAQHYINQGGCDMALFRVSQGTVESGVQVGNYFFPSWPVKDSDPTIRMCIFAFPYDIDASTPARVVARDDAGNETLVNFNYKVFPKKFKSDTMNLTDDFMQRVVPAIMSQTPEMADQGSLLKNFLLVNGPLRRMDAQQLLAFSQKTASHLTWTQPFVQLKNSKVEASFADYRTYLYNGQVVDHQTHLGFDLAVVQHTPVVAANVGRVIYVGFLGIYGNVVVIDHGCGLQSFYAHLSSFDVKEGEEVKHGQVIAHSGQTGLAGGDHLHFTMLLDGIPVNPVEWWDPHWIHDRIEAKLQPYLQK
jgi:murein DD-endopeptidase MepM/ murein hydrolase activator NlpD